MRAVGTPAILIIMLLWSATSPADDVVRVSDTIEARATVTAVNKSQRRILLRDDKAVEYEVVAGPEVRNFDQIKKGDVVHVTYHRAAASRLEKVSAGHVPFKVTEVKRGLPGGKPSVSTIQAQTITAKVIEIDTRHRLLTVQGPKGNLVTVHVPPTLLAFDKLEIGDTIAAGYTEAMAISVRPPDPKK